jgi:hypothetical protein
MLNRRRPSADNSASSAPEGGGRTPPRPKGLVRCCLQKSSVAPGKPSPAFRREDFPVVGAAERHGLGAGRDRPAVRPGPARQRRTKVGRQRARPDARKGISSATVGPTLADSVIELCKSNVPIYSHGADGRSEARTKERSFSCERHTRLLFAWSFCRMSCFVRRRLFASWPLKSPQTFSVGLRSGA